MLDEVLYLTPEEADGPNPVSGFTEELIPSDPPIMIPGIDEAGQFFPVEKIQAHREGIHHLALSVFVFDGPHLLIQRRADHKYHCGGLWANTCCTHPHMDEDIEVAAKRRLQEELGFSLPVQEKLIVEYSADVGGGLWERERVHMFRAQVDRTRFTFEPNPDEVSQTRWITAEELHSEIKETPELFTPWFRIYVNRFPALDF
ncbi:MAG: NUDIX domain-containing protein [Pseudomonadota bacterium]